MGGRAVAIRHMQSQMLSSAAGRLKNGKKIPTLGSCAVSCSAEGLPATEGMNITGDGCKMQELCLIDVGFAVGLSNAHYLLYIKIKTNLVHCLIFMLIHQLF